jgi:hypothetical protein
MIIHIIAFIAATRDVIRDAFALRAAMSRKHPSLGE